MNVRALSEVFDNADDQIQEADSIDSQQRAVRDHLAHEMHAEQHQEHEIVIRAGSNSRRQAFGVRRGD